MNYIYELLKKFNYHPLKYFGRQQSHMDNKSYAYLLPTKRKFSVFYRIENICKKGLDTDLRNIQSFL